MYVLNSCCVRAQSPLACDDISPAHLSGSQFHILEDGLVMSGQLLGREVGRDLWRYGLPYLTVRVFLKCLRLTSVLSSLTTTALAKVTIEVHMVLDLSVAV